MNITTWWKKPNWIKIACGLTFIEIKRKREGSNLKIINNFGYNYMIKIILTARCCNYKSDHLPNFC